MAGTASGNTGFQSGNGRLEFRLLGPVEVLRDGEPLKLGGARQRTLLAVLLIRVNELVTTTRLVQELFGERASDSGVSAVRVAVSRLGSRSTATTSDGRLTRGPVVTSCAPHPIR